MIGSFPVGYPDELLYSICARYGDRMQYSAKRMISKELFGTQQPTAVVGLPSHIDHLITNLQVNSSYTVNKIIDNHTLFPFYAPFLPVERAERLRACMRTRDSSPIHLLAGHTMPGRVGLELLRFCPECATNERADYGECYWHRVHQILEVKVCPAHAIWLEQSTVQIHDRVNAYSFTSAETSCSTSSSRSVDLSITQNQHLMHIAIDVDYLLNSAASTLSLEARKILYREALVRRDLASFLARLRPKELVREIECYFGKELLFSLGHEVTWSKSGNWTSQIVRPSGIVQSPIRHILMTRFLGYTASEFCKLPTDAVASYGVGPWPCLNKTCVHHGQPVITECDVRYRKLRGRVPVGVFTCTCGFSYSRRGADTCAEDRLRYTRIEQFGPVFDTTLMGVWPDPAITMREITHRLGVQPSTILRRAVRIGLTVPRPGGRKSEINPAYLPRSRKQRSIDEVTRSKYREQWLKAREQNPDKGRTALRREFATTCWWLYTFDNAWLSVNYPAQQKGSNRSKLRVDWKSLDERLSAQVPVIAEMLRALDGPPVQITAASIGRKLRQLGLHKEHLAGNLAMGRLPLMKAAISLVLETPEDIAVRRIQLIAELYRKEGVTPTRYQLTRRSYTYRLRNVDKVSKALDDGIESFQR